jgi:predicted enzyme related to lactoylglutathione lyase
MRRLFDHIDLRVSSLAEVKGFYTQFFPAIGFPVITENPDWIGFEAKREEPTPEFIGVIDDAAHRPNTTRLAFWAETKEEVDRIAKVVAEAGGKNVEGPMFNPEYAPNYYALFFEDPCGNRLEVCCRTARG